MFDIIKRNAISNEDEDLSRAKKPEINYNAFYRAIVYNNRDPFNLGRVQIRIPAIHGSTPGMSNYIEPEGLPWAMPASLVSAGNDMGMFIIPPMGSIVFVTFEVDDSEYPIYFGGLPSKVGLDKRYIGLSGVYGGKAFNVSTDDLITDIKNGSEQVVYKSIKGSTIIIDDKDGDEYIKIIDADGQQIIMKNSSDFALPRRGNLTVPGKESYIEITRGNENIKLSDGKIEINAPEVLINGKAIE